MGDVDDGGRELSGEIGALHSRITRLEQVSHELVNQKNVDEELDKAWHEWETTFDAAKDSIVLTDSEFKIIQANLAASRLFAKPIDQIVGKTCWQLVHGTDHPPRDCPLEKARSSRKHEEIEIYLPQKDIWVTASVDPVFDQQGNLSGAIHIIRDVTDRKQAERLLRKERDRAQKYLDVAGVMLVAIDAEQRVGLINKKGGEILGYKEEEVIAKNWFDNFLPKRIKEEVKGVFNKLLCGEADAPEYYENPILTKDGQERLIAWHNTVLRDDKGKVIAALGSGEDITERKRAEEALHESEEKYRNLFESAREAIVILDLKGNITDVNKLVEEYGIKREEVIGKSHFDFIPEKYRENSLKEFEELTCGIPVQGEVEVITPKGNMIVEYRNNPIRRGGQIVGIQEILIDITERKKAEEALQHSEEYFRAITENSSDIIIIVDKKGTILYVSSSIERFSGYKPEELIGKSAFEFIHPDDFPRAVNDFSEAIQTKDVAVPNSFRIRHKDGSEFVLEGVGKNLLDNPVIKGFVMNVRDVTERKHAEEAHRLSEEKFAKAFNSSPAAIFITTLKEGRFIDLNEIAIRVFGYTREEAVGHTAKELNMWANYNDRDIVVQSIRRGNAVRDMEARFRRKSGEVFDSIISVDIINIGGTECLISTIVDITERKKAEQKLLEDQAQLKSLASELTLTEERERHRLATELHDRISQSLVISKIKLEALRKSGHSRKLDKALEEVCNSLGQTVQDTRTLTFDLSNPVLYELGFETAVSEWLADQIQKKHGIAVEFEDDGKPKPLDDDVRVLLFRDVRELLINVVKHANAHKVKVSVRKLDNRICVTVEDDGVGFDPADVISMAAKRGEFGLFSIRERLEDLGGHLQIDSAPGCGCKVTMTAPLKQKEMTR
jgi:PAS domain S-box-containing protein